MLAGSFGKTKYISANVVHGWFQTAKRVSGMPDLRLHTGKGSMLPVEQAEVLLLSLGIVVLDLLLNLCVLERVSCRGGHCYKREWGIGRQRGYHDRRHGLALRGPRVTRYPVEE